MKKDLLWPSAPGGGADAPGGIAGHVRGAALEIRIAKSACSQT